MALFGHAITTTKDGAVTFIPVAYVVQSQWILGECAPLATICCFLQLVLLRQCNFLVIYKVPMLQRFQHWLQCSIRSCYGINKTTSRPQLLTDTLNGTIAIRRNSSSSKVETSRRKKQRHRCHLWRLNSFKGSLRDFGEVKISVCVFSGFSWWIAMLEVFFIESDFRLVMVYWFYMFHVLQEIHGAMTQLHSLTTFSVWTSMLKHGTMAQSLLPSLILGVR